MFNNILNINNKSWYSPKIIHIFLWGFASFWILYGLYGFYAPTAYYLQEIIIKSIAVFMISNGAMFLLILWGYYRKKIWLYYFGLSWIGINIILLITDNFGWSDFIYILLSCYLLVIIFKNKTNYKKVN